MRPKPVTDFVGLYYSVTDQLKHVGSGRLPVNASMALPAGRHLSPQVVVHVQDQADVFSADFTCLELLTRRSDALRGQSQIELSDSSY